MCKLLLGGMLFRMPRTNNRKPSLVRTPTHISEMTWTSTTHHTKPVSQGTWYCLQPSVSFLSRNLEIFKELSGKTMALLQRAIWKSIKSPPGRRMFWC